jgi:predicted RNA methylase
MAINVEEFLKILADFYNFSGQTVIAVGAGGGQLVEFLRKAARVHAVDSDPEALEKLRLVLEKLGLADRFSLLGADFLETDLQGDLVVFEFSLHEMANPQQALEHALRAAPRVMVFDHWPESTWAWIVNETGKAARGWRAVEELGPVRIERHDTLQFFRDYRELHEKVSGQGRESVERIAPYRGRSEFTVPMSYYLALIGGEASR